MIPIFIASTTGYAGRTFVAVGLGAKLIEQGYRVGYIKPLGKTPVKKGKNVYDADALFMKETLGLAEPLEVISPFVETYESRTLLLAGNATNVKKRVFSAFKLLKKKEFVIISGAGNLFDGSLVGLDTLSLVNDMKARILMVEAWPGEAATDSLFGASKLFGGRFCGGVINKVPVHAMSHVNDTVRPFLEKKGVKIYGVFPKERSLEAISVRQLNTILAGTVLCCEDKLDKAVENFSVGAMDVDSALNYFRRTPNKAVITGTHRSDIQLAALETSTRCIILTGGLTTNAVVIGRAQAKGVPIISVRDDTFTTIEKIEVSMGKTHIREERKVERVKELMDALFDLKRFLKNVK